MQEKGSAEDFGEVWKHHEIYINSTHLFIVSLSYDRTPIRWFVPHDRRLS